MKKQGTVQNETVKMVENAMGVLDLLRTKKEPLGVREIAKSCELNPSTTFRILTTLENSGWVYKTNDDRYITGQKLSFVTEKDCQKRFRLNQALPFMPCFTRSRSSARLASFHLSMVPTR